MDDDIDFKSLSPIEWPVEFSKFYNLIYSRLDLPEPPVLDEDKFIWWCEKSEKFLQDLPSNQYIQSGNIKLNYRSAYHANMDVRKEPFPYTMYPAMTRFKSLTDDPWVENFNILFPDMVDYYHTFPGHKFRSLGFIKQNANMKVWDHTDNDGWIGFRFYLKNNCTTNNLYFRQIKKEYASRDRYTTYIYGGDRRHVRDFSKLIEDEKIFVKNNSGRYAWALTSTKATHGIEASSENETRITGILEYWPVNIPGVVAGFKVKETFDLFERSISKYGDTSIWYK